MNKLQRKTYTKPILNSEAFVPNTYVAACALENGVTEYTLSCTASDNWLEKHSDDGCRRPLAFKVTVTDGHITKITEAGNTSGYWDGGECENIRIQPGNQKPENVTISPNGTYNLTWTTDVGYDMNHSGTLNCATAQYKNMS